LFVKALERPTPEIDYAKRHQPYVPEKSLLKFSGKRYNPSLEFVEIEGGGPMRLTDSGGTDGMKGDSGYGQILTV
jgi:hypothetical protein